jgi:hypothetical protein
MRRDREDQLDLGYVGRGADAATHWANIAPAARRPRRTDLVVAFLGANVREHGRADCALAGPPTVFTFSEDTHRNAQPPAVEFGVEIRPPRLFRIVESQGASHFACA